MSNALYRLYRTPEKLIGQLNLELKGANFHDQIGRFAGQVESVGDVDIVLSDKLDWALSCLKKQDGNIIELQYLAGGLAAIGAQLRTLEDIAHENKSTLNQLQQDIDSLIKKSRSDMAAKIKSVMTLLRLADKKEPTDAKAYIEANHLGIEESINIFDEYILDILRTLPPSNYIIVEIINQLFIIAKLRAKILLIVGDTQGALDTLSACYAKIENEARHLLKEWTKNVDLRDIAPDGPDDLNNLLVAMECIDGVGPHKRLCTIFYQTPRPPEKTRLESLRLINKNRYSSHDIQNLKLQDIENLKLVRSGDLFYWNDENYALTEMSGYLLVPQTYGSIEITDCHILNVPASCVPAKETSEKIYTLAHLVTEAKKIHAEGIIANEFPHIANKFINLLTEDTSKLGQNRILLIPATSSETISSSD